MNFMNPLYITQEGIKHTQGYGGYPNHGERYAFHRQRYPHDYKKKYTNKNLKEISNLRKQMML